MECLGIDVQLSHFVSIYLFIITRGSSDAVVEMMAWNKWKKDRLGSLLSDNLDYMYMTQNR